MYLLCSVCGFSTVDNIALMNVEGSGMIGGPGITHFTSFVTSLHLSPLFIYYFTSFDTSFHLLLLILHFICYFTIYFLIFMFWMWLTLLIPWVCWWRCLSGVRERRTLVSRNIPDRDMLTLLLLRPRCAWGLRLLVTCWSLECVVDCVWVAYVNAGLSWVEIFPIETCWHCYSCARDVLKV
jgi:hypothetical protein